MESTGPFSPSVPPTALNNKRVLLHKHKGVKTFWRQCMLKWIILLILILRSFYTHYKKAFTFSLFLLFMPPITVFHFSWFSDRGFLASIYKLNSGCRYDRLFRDFLKTVFREFLGYSYFYHINFDVHIDLK